MQNNSIYSRAGLLITLSFILMACQVESPKQIANVPDDDPVNSVTADAPVTVEISGELKGNCTDAEYRQLDFWVGHWDLTWAQPDGSEGTGENIISHDPYGNCIIMENFDGAPTLQFKGMSVSTYLKPAKMWRQAWVDNSGGFFSLYGGPQDDGSFLLDMERVNDQGPYRRMIWKNIKADSLDWHWQGKTDEDAEWTDAWVIYYKRK